MSRPPAHAGGSRQGPDRGQDRGRGYRRIDDRQVEVIDLDLAAWVHMHGVPIVEALKFGKETVVTFRDIKPEDGSPGEVDKYAIKWLNSEASKFANHVRNLKKVAFSTARYRPPREERHR